MESDSFSSAYLSTWLSALRTGSGSHCPTYCSRRERAERSWSMARRVVTVTKYALGT